MQRFNYSLATFRKMLIIDEIRLLEKTDFKDRESCRHLIPSFDRQYITRHKNTYLLLALAWNYLNAAKILIALDVKKISLNLTDLWPTCLNTPLILSAKIHATDIACQLIDAGALLDCQDYRGFTALHYACLMRNEILIKKLLEKGAATYLRNAFSQLPADCYQMNITPDDLVYRYGVENDWLVKVPDCNEHYFATKKKCLSAFRWFIPHIMVNMGIGKDVFINRFSLYNIAKYLLNDMNLVESPLCYQKMMLTFCQHRSAMHADLLTLLQPDKTALNVYTEEKWNSRYRLFPLDMVPRSAIFCVKQGKVNEIWVEMQEMKR